MNARWIRTITSHTCRECFEEFPEGSVMVEIPTEYGFPTYVCEKCAQKELEEAE